MDPLAEQPSTCSRCVPMKRFHIQPGGPNLRLKTLPTGLALIVPSAGQFLTGSHEELSHLRVIRSPVSHFLAAHRGACRTVEAPAQLLLDGVTHVLTKLQGRHVHGQAVSPSISLPLTGPTQKPCLLLTLLKLLG